MDNPVDRFIPAPDGLRLHYAEYGAHDWPGAPVVCLPGLTRAARDFDPLARALAFGGAVKRRVLALDYRGRGLSAYDTEWRRYDLATESADILAVLAAADISRALFVGTSRGGLHIMALAAVRPEVLLGVALNDIGPIVEPAGLMRIKNTVGKAPPLASWPAAIAFMRRAQGRFFPRLSDAEWETWARMTFADRDGALTPRYDPALANTLASVTPDMAQLDLWPQFEALGATPALFVRGALSDVLSSETFAAMGRAHAGAECLTVDGQGHAPLLIDAPTIARIAAFVERVEAAS